MNYCFNLCVVDICLLLMVQNMMGIVRKFFEFFSNLFKCQYYFVDKIKELLFNSNYRILIDVCCIWWIVCIDGLDRIVEFLVLVLLILEDVQFNKDKNGVVCVGIWNFKSWDDVWFLFNVVIFGFIVMFVIVKYILNLIRFVIVKL